MLSLAAKNLNSIAHHASGMTGLQAGQCQLMPAELMMMACKLWQITRSSSLQKGSVTFQVAELAEFYLPDALLLIGARGLWVFWGGRPPSPALSPLAVDGPSRACAHSIVLTVRIYFTDHGICRGCPPPLFPPPTFSNLLPIGNSCRSTTFRSIRRINSTNRP